MSKAWTVLVSEMSPKCYGDGDTTRPHSEWKRQRKEGMIEGVLKGFGRLFCRRIVLFLIEELPTCCRDDQTTCDLHDKKGDAEEGQNFAAEEGRDEEKRKTVGCDLARQDFLRGLGIVSSETKKDWGIANRVHNWE